jgi:hypothetical protein
LKYNDRKWTHKRLDTGTVYYDAVLDKMKDYVSDGTPQRVYNGPLDGAGGVVAKGEPPFVLEFSIYPQISFSFLRA